MKKILFAALLFVLFFPALVFAQKAWKPYIYNISFKIKNAGINVNGKFTGFQSDMRFSPDKLAQSVLNASVEVNTINTGIDKRDKDLQGEKYFNSDKYKLIEVKSAKLYQKGSGYAGLFNVTIKGVTKQVEIPFEFNRNGNDAEFKGSFDLNRRDFGVGGGGIMSDKLTVNILVKAKS